MEQMKGFGGPDHTKNLVPLQCHCSVTVVSLQCHCSVYQCLGSLFDAPQALIVSWLRPTDRPTMSLIELSWTAKKMCVHLIYHLISKSYYLSLKKVMPCVAGHSKAMQLLDLGPSKSEWKTLQMFRQIKVFEIF